MTKVWWSMKDLEEQTGKSRNWLKANILEIPKYKSIIEEFGHYPKHNNDQYCFIGKEMEKFLEDRFHEIFHFREVS